MMVRRVMLLLVARAGLSMPLHATTDEATVLISAEPLSGAQLLEDVIVSALETHCVSQAGCRIGVKVKESEPIVPEYTVAVSTWPGSRRMISTALKHTIPNVGHSNGQDWENFPRLEPGELASKVGKTLSEMPAGGKYIVLFRDPRDVVMSACCRLSNCKDPDSFALHNITKVTRWTALRHRFFSAIQKERPHQVMFVFYEDLLVDTGNVAHDIAEFIQAPVSRSVLSKLVHGARTKSENRTVSMRKAPHTCGFTHELSAETIRTLNVCLRKNLPMSLYNQWSCGGGV